MLTGSCPLRWSAPCTHCHRYTGTVVLWLGVGSYDRCSDGDRLVESYLWSRQEPGQQASSCQCWVWCSAQLWLFLPPVLWHQPLVCISHVLYYLIYMVGHKKNVALYFCPYFCQLMTDFQNSFTVTIMWLLYILPHRNCISALPCEIWMKYECIMIITNKHFGKIEKKTLPINILVNDLYDTRLCGSNTV